MFTEMVINLNTEIVINLKLRHEKLNSVDQSNVKSQMQPLQKYSRQGHGRPRQNFIFNCQGSLGYYLRSLPRLPWQRGIHGISINLHLTDIPRQREEYEVIYGTRRNAECHITSILRAGVEYLFYFMTNSRYILSQNKTILPKPNKTWP